MVIIRMDRKILYLVFSALLVLSIVFNIFLCVGNNKLENRYDSLLYITDQFNNTSTVAFVATAEIQGNRQRDVEVFDISKGEVIKKMKPDNLIKSEAEKYLGNITGMYVKVNAFPEKGFIVRVPFEPYLAVQSHWLNDYGINSVGECFIIFPDKGKPYLLVLDSSYRPFFYNFKGDTKAMLDQLGMSIY